MSFAGVPGSTGGPQRFESIFGVVRDGAFVPSFKKDVSIRTSLPPGDLPKNTWSPIQQQFAYRLSNEKRPGTVIQYHKPVIGSNSLKSPQLKQESGKKSEPLFNQTQLERQWDRRVRTEELENEIANQKYVNYGDMHRETLLNKNDELPPQPLTPQQQVENYRTASAKLLSGTTRAARYSFQRPFPSPARRNSFSHPTDEATKTAISNYEEDHGKPLMLHLHSDQRTDLLKSQRVEVLRREITSGPSRTSRDTAVMKALVFPDSNSIKNETFSTENHLIGQCNLNNDQQNNFHKQQNHSNNLFQNSPQTKTLKHELFLRKQQREQLQGQNADLQDQLNSLHKQTFSKKTFYNTSQNSIGSKVTQNSSMMSPGVMSRNTLTSKEMFERQLASKTKVVF